MSVATPCRNAVRMVTATIRRKMCQKRVCQQRVRALSLYQILIICSVFCCCCWSLTGATDFVLLLLFWHNMFWEYLVRTYNDLTAGLNGEKKTFRILSNTQQWKSESCYVLVKRLNEPSFVRSICVASSTSKWWIKHCTTLGCDVRRTATHTHRHNQKYIITIQCYTFAL